jgi:hypothetical protein
LDSSSDKVGAFKKTVLSEKFRHVLFLRQPSCRLFGKKRDRAENHPEGTKRRERRKQEVTGRTQPLRGEISAAAQADACPMPIPIFLAVGERLHALYLGHV